MKSQINNSIKVKNNILKHINIYNTSVDYYRPVFFIKF